VFIIIVHNYIMNKPYISPCLTYSAQKLLEISDTYRNQKRLKINLPFCSSVTEVQTKCSVLIFLK